MRLIDADQMAVDESEAYMSAQVQITDDLKWLVNFAAHSKIQRLIADTPAVDAVPVVRCRDCEFSIDYCGYLVCSLSARSRNPKANYIVNPDFFCAHGKRKEST